MPSSQESLRLALALSGLVIVVGAGVVFGMPIALLTLAALVLLFGIAMIWSSVQSLTGETPISLEEALTLGAPSAEEEQKRSVLRALKDLEYERSVGKITAEDYQLLSARYRADAIRLMQRLDESLRPARARAERLLKDRLAKAGLGEAEAEAPSGEDAAPTAAAPGVEGSLPEPGPEPDREPTEPVQASDAPVEAPAPEVKS